MTNRTSHIITLLLALLVLATACAQSKENKRDAKKLDTKIKTETGYYLYPTAHSHWPDSLCLMWVKEHDTNGQLVKYVDHWRCGQPYCIYEYEYDETGMCNKSWVSYYTNNFKRTAMVHKYD